MSPLRGEVIFTIEPFAADKLWKQARWINGSERTLRIKKASVWIGLTLGGKCDLEGSMWVEGIGGLLVAAQWDRYANPSSPHTWTQDFAPDWVEVLPGGSIRLDYRAAKVSSDGAPKAALVGAVWYEV